MLDDPTLLRRYADERSEAAFAELVARHLPLVYTAAARRLSGDAHRAQDVAQLVFCALARDAHRLSRHATLTGWLYTTTRNAVVDVVRSERSRQAREKEAHAMQEISSDPEAADWSRLKPVLDDALDHLAATDREAVLLRFFQGRAFAEIGAALGLSEDTARKRVERAA
ncbi:MAG: sigma-70 family RNA polymerase sigma factor, partial [Verrucomicrobiota bacterium]